jgi:hypothetical protein
MRKKKNLHTSFIKFLLEKYNNETQKLPHQLPDEETTEEPQNKKHIRKLYEIEDDEVETDDEVEEPTDDEVETDDEIIDELLNEYRLLMKQKRRMKKTNENRFHNRMRRKK